MRVLISCFACEPGYGSEVDVGWSWVVQAAKHHEVWVITPAYNRQPIETYLSKQPIANLHFAYHASPFEAQLVRLGRWKHPFFYAIYLLWQLSAARTARALYNEIRFDVVQHLTWATQRFPSCLGLADLGVPFIWGPIGGGEETGWRVYSKLGVRATLAETLRNLSNRLVGIDPWTRRTIRNAHLILTTTPDTLRRLPKDARAKAEIYPAIGIHLSQIDSSLAHRDGDMIKILYVGRLTNWKGVEFAIRAFADVAKTRDVRLTIAGEGPERQRLREQADSLGVRDKVTFAGQLSREAVFELYREHDIFLFPSLHDSGGLAVLEAMAFGLPVVCLDLGGPALSVDGAGMCLPAHDGDQVERDLASALRRLIDDPDERRRLGELARQRVEERYDWDKKGDFIRALYERFAERPDAVPNYLRQAKPKPALTREKSG